jgi:16S rRNA (guanine(527)-N(7))-methyltransferase RsmG
VKSELNSLLETHKLPEGSRLKILDFYEFLIRENQIQNLTRLVEPQDFYYGHFLDAWELAKSGLVKFPAMDLGSGVGVPGILTALISDGKWVLAESEMRKADYLQKAVDLLELGGQVTVAPGRAEESLKVHSVSTVGARAVGSVERIYGWSRNCSTWNSMVLLKGPGWKEEWARFQVSKHRRELQIQRETYYEVGPEKKSRCIVEIQRVPRSIR